jgi:hypothetical protein
MLEKPASVANDPFKSAKWDELAEGSGLTQADAPALGPSRSCPTAETSGPSSTTAKS